MHGPHFAVSEACKPFSISQNMHIRFSPIAAAVFAACGVVANAQTVSNQYVTGSYALPGLSTNYSQTGNTINSSTGNVFQNTWAGLFPGALVYGNASTGQLSSVAQSGGEESGYVNGTTVPFSDANTSVTYHATYTNDSAVAQAYNFHFNIANGGLGISPNFGDTPSSASFMGSIRVNNTVAWSTQAAVTWTSADTNNANQGNYVAPTLTHSGVDIGYVAYNGSWPLGGPFTEFGYSFGGYTGSVSLGLLNPGQSVDVEYTLQNIATTTNGSAYYGGAISFVNDPVAVHGGNTNGVPGVSVSVAAVPEPESAALLAAGVGLLAARMRRRKSK